MGRKNLAAPHVTERKWSMFTGKHWGGQGMGQSCLMERAEQTGPLGFQRRTSGCQDLKCWDGGQWHEGKQNTDPSGGEAYLKQGRRSQQMEPCQWASSKVMSSLIKRSVQGWGPLRAHHRMSPVRWSRQDKGPVPFPLAWEQTQIPTGPSQWARQVQGSW